MQVITPHPSDLGDGFLVHRALPSAARRAVGPFVFLDQFGPVQLAPGKGLDVRPHPHIGLATVSYLFEGTILHRDSLGSVVPIRPGEVNWMTAGRGITHSERSPDELRADGPRLWGLQFWVALPLELEQCPPAFAHHGADEIPRVARPGARLSVVLGEAFGATSPVALTSPMFLVDVTLDPGATLELDLDAAERAAYVLEGEVRANASKSPTAKEHLIVFDAGEPARLTAGSEPAHVVLLGGPKLDAPRFLWWNFVSSDRDLIIEAQAAWTEQRFPKVPGESEFIPLPARPLPPGSAL
ncbi:MAG: pirin family protein [Caulobacter sp.]|nr:pirin family protein [Vitreoscilla sp.]